MIDPLHDCRNTKTHKRRMKYPRVSSFMYWWQRFLYFRLGIAWHNSWSGECTHNFSCCAEFGNNIWWRMPMKGRKVDKLVDMSPELRSVQSMLVKAVENNETIVMVPKKGESNGY